MTLFEIMCMKFVPSSPFSFVLRYQLKKKHQKTSSSPFFQNEPETKLCNDSYETPCNSEQHAHGVMMTKKTVENVPHITNNSSWCSWMLEGVIRIKRGYHRGVWCVTSYVKWINSWNVQNIQGVGIHLFL